MMVMESMNALAADPSLTTFWQVLVSVIELVITNPASLILIIIIALMSQRNSNKERCKDDYNKEVLDINEDYKNKIKSIVTKVVSRIELAAIKKTTTVISDLSKDPKTCPNYIEGENGECARCASSNTEESICVFTKDSETSKREIRHQLKLYTFILREGLHGDVGDAIHVRLESKPLMYKTELELENHIYTNAIDILTVSRKHLSEYANDIPCIIDLDESRFSQDSARKTYTSIVKEYILLESERIKELEKATKRYENLINFKLPDVIKFIKTIKKI
jgi:hypothetical protein